MGTEYFLVKPGKEEVFYLGKHFSCPYGIANRTYKKEADYIDYECWDDFFWDFLRENSYCFEENTIEQCKEVISEIYEWCLDDKIYFDHDCHVSPVEWKDYKETGSLIDLFEKLNNKL